MLGFSFLEILTLLTIFFFSGIVKGILGIGLPAIAISISWHAISDWEMDQKIEEDKTILLFLPKDKNKGIILRSKGYAESTISSSEYKLDKNENLNIKTVYSSTISEERICFLSNHIRSRYSVIRNQENNSVIQTSHTSEIRNISILKD